jgi:tellurium resistance protein TerZ
MLDDCGATMDAVFYNKLKSDDGAIVHSGDSKDGVIKGYNEVITIDLAKLNFGVAYMVIIVNSYNGQSFKKVETATCSIL